ncbi:unnamed protein product [Tenebrio molitor]|nr:unnamed protein product [Tenebrio molitor]
MGCVFVPVEAANKVEFLFRFILFKCCSLLYWVNTFVLFDKDKL